MSNYKVRIEDIIGSVGDDTALSDWLTEGARLVVKLIPEDKVERYVTASIAVGSGDPTPNYVTISNYRPIRAHKDGYSARLIDPGLKAQAIDSASIHLATIKDPVWYIELSKAYILPDGGTVIGILYPEVAYDDITIPNFPIELDNAVVTYAAIKGRIRQISVLYDSIGTFLFDSGSLPVAPASPSFTFTPVTYTDADYNAAVYIDALIDTIDPTTLSFSETLAYNRPVFQGNYTNTDTALTQEDIELANAHLSKVGVQLNEMQNELNSSMNAFNKDKVIFDTAFQQAMTDAQLTQQRLIEQTRLQIQLNQFNTQQALQTELANASQEMQLDITNKSKATEVAIVNASKELERQIQEFQAKLSIYAQAMNGYSVQIQAESARIGIELQKINTQSQLLLASLQELRLEFQEALKIIGI